MSARRRDGLSIVGLGAAACFACCAGPLLAFLGGLTIAGTVSTVFVGAAGLLVAAVAATAFVVAGRRPSRCSPEPAGPVAVASPTASRRTKNSPAAGQPASRSPLGQRARCLLMLTSGEWV